MSHRPPRRGTLASLAAELGVSRTTVSNAYNHPDQLSEGLREKILKAAAARGYPGPDPTARSLRTRRIGSIGVLMTEHLAYAFQDHASVDFLAGLAESSYGTQNMLTLVPVGPGEDEPDTASTLINRAVVDGFVVYSVAQDDPNLLAVQNSGLPVVLCDQPANVPDIAYVGIDDAAAIVPAAQALIDAGHRRIGIIGKRLTRLRHDGPVTEADLASASLHVQRDRIYGALDVFADAGIDKASVPIVVRHHNDHATAVDAARELLSTHPELTAVLCTTDSMAFGVLAYAQQRGWSIPEELSVTGFDGVDVALERGLTTIIQPNKAKGAEAGRLLGELVDAYVEEEIPPPPTRTILATHFSPGRTIGEPRLASETLR